MLKNIKEIYIAVQADEMNLDKHNKKQVDKVFKNILGDRTEKVSDVTEANRVELIYSIQPPLFSTDESNREFFESIDELLEELNDYSPFFTTFKNEGGINK